ncbi:unnamed protein product [Pleuronectes platessa]|uniref:Myosin motor domain-containing protein n=1 Tax=Pleuronectes platessa TaxID=8262 RepID=A0A9N7Y9T9_PLEPL|nr:unnamed protein product [Pleuronectes platessa]
MWTKKNESIKLRQPMKAPPPRSTGVHPPTHTAPIHRAAAETRDQKHDNKGATRAEIKEGGKPAANMEVKTSLLDNMIGVGDMVLLEPLSEDSFIENLKNRFEHNKQQGLLNCNLLVRHSVLGLELRLSTIPLLGRPAAAVDDSQDDRCSARWAIEREAVGGCGVATGKATLRSRQSGLCNSHYHGEQRQKVFQTYIGSVVISMNPYRNLPIFTPEKVEEYRNRNFYELSPHIDAPENKRQAADNHPSPRLPLTLLHTHTHAGNNTTVSVSCTCLDWGHRGAGPNPSWQRERGAGSKPGQPHPPPIIHPSSPPPANLAKRSLSR